MGTIDTRTMPIHIYYPYITTSFNSFTNHFSLITPLEIYPDRKLPDFISFSASLASSIDIALLFNSPFTTPIADHIDIRFPDIFSIQQQHKILCQPPSHFNTLSQYLNIHILTITSPACSPFRTRFTSFQNIVLFPWISYSNRHPIASPPFFPPL